jgi:hypothetical protein
MTPLWTSWWDQRSRAALRLGLALIVGVVFTSQALLISRMALDPQHFGGAGPLHRLLAGAPWLPWFALAATLLGLAAVAADRRPVLGGVWALAWMAVLSVLQAELFGSPSRNSFFPGAALLGWVLGLAWARETGAPRSARERFAEAGALACIAAGYVGSASSKVLTSGLAWASAGTVQALVIWQEPLAHWRWLLAYRAALLEHPTLAAVAAASTLVIEGGAFLLLFGARLRLAWATLIIGMHLNIILLCTMPYLEPMALLLLFSIPWARRSAAAEPEPEPEPRAAFPPAMRWVLGALVVVGWLLAPLGWRSA